MAARDCSGIFFDVLFIHITHTLAAAFGASSCVTPQCSCSKQQNIMTQTCSLPFYSQVWEELQLHHLLLWLRRTKNVSTTKSCSLTAVIFLNSHSGFYSVKSSCYSFQVIVSCLITYPSLLLTAGRLWGTHNNTVSCLYAKGFFLYGCRSGLAGCSVVNVSSYSFAV